METGLMKAFVRVDAHSQVVEMTEIAVPEPGDGEILVAVHAFGVGIHDRYFISQDGPFPYTIGIEGSGVVVSPGPEGNGLNVGDRVMVSTSMNPKGGTWAEFAVINDGNATVIPDSLDFEMAAGIPVAGKSAVDSMHALDLKVDETLYVAGASGAIGTLVVQMAAQRGVRVVGSASPTNHEYLRSLGAELAVDYSDPNWLDQVRSWSNDGVDAALAIQPGTAETSRDVTRDGGRVITVSGDQCQSERGIRVEQFQHRSEASKDIANLVDDIDAGRIRLVLEHVYPFEEALTALEKTETRHARGKLVVTVPQDR